MVLKVKKQKNDIITQRDECIYHREWSSRYPENCCKNTIKQYIDCMHKFRLQATVTTIECPGCESSIQLILRPN